MPNITTDTKLIDTVALGVAIDLINEKITLAEMGENGLTISDNNEYEPINEITNMEEETL